jgi:hypothetical protein
MMRKEPSVASVYLTKNKKLLRCEVRVRGERKAVNFPVTPVLKRDHQFLRNLFDEIEGAAKCGCPLSKDSQETLRRIQQSNPKAYSQMLDEQWFHSISNLTIAEAFDLYIESQSKKGWDWKTIRNWNQTKAHVLQQITPATGVRMISLKQMDEAFTDLRSTYKAGTLDKDAKNVRQLFAWLLDMGDIIANPIAKLRFKCPRGERVRVKAFVRMDEFVKVLSAFYDEEIEQKCLFAYYRLMGARQSDPTGDHWADFDESRSCINRSDIKKRGKLGPCPIDPLLKSLLLQHRQRVIQKYGKAEGPIFPWLRQSTPANQYRFFKARIERAGVQVWEPLLHSLRSSRAQEIRRLVNGSFLESQWLGHSDQMASDHYDAVMDSDMAQVTERHLGNGNQRNGEAVA